VSEEGTHRKNRVTESLVLPYPLEQSRTHGFPNRCGEDQKMIELFDMLRDLEGYPGKELYLLEIAGNVDRVGIINRSSSLILRYCPAGTSWDVLS
jgi:hypothetical protein